MQCLEVSDAVRHIYIYIHVYVIRRLRGSSSSFLRLLPRLLFTVNNRSKEICVKDLYRITLSYARITNREFRPNTWDLNSPNYLVMS